MNTQEFTMLRLGQIHRSVSGALRVRFLKSRLVFRLLLLSVFFGEFKPNYHYCAASSTFPNLQYLFIKPPNFTHWTFNQSEPSSCCCLLTLFFWLFLFFSSVSVTDRRFSQFPRMSRPCSRASCELVDTRKTNPGGLGKTLHLSRQVM